MPTSMNIESATRLLLLWSVAVAAGGFAFPARADIDWSSADWGGYSVDSLSYWARSDLTRRSSERMQEISRENARSRSAPSKRKPQPPEALSTSGNVSASGRFEDESGIDQLARMYPREQFAERKKQYRQILQSFNQSVQKLYGVPPNNLATGMTVALAGAYAAYHQKSFPDGWVKPLYRQMEGLMLKDPRLSERSSSKKVVDYQVLVGTGMVMMLAQSELQKTPNTAGQTQLRRAGADVLRTVFQTDPQNVEFSSDGLAIR